MISLLSKFLRRVRIRGGEFDASARAMHREAAFGNVSNATIERKLMSTKTTLKRIALVAVAATGFGLLSVVPSSAVTQGDTLTLGATATSVANNTATSTTLTQTFAGVLGDTMSVTSSIVSYPSGATPQVATLSANLGSVVGSVPIITTASTSIAQFGDTGSATVLSTATGVYTVNFPAQTTAGQYVYKFTPLNVTVSTQTPAAAAITWTVTVGAATAATADTTSTAYLTSSLTADGTSTTDSAGLNAALTTNTQVGQVTVTPMLSSAASTVNITATITSGPGSLGISSSSRTPNSTGRSLTTTTAASKWYVGIYADGTAGTSTITISSGSTVLATKTVVFYGTIAKVTATVVNSVVAVGSTNSNVGAITAVAYDSLGNVVPVGTLYATSDTAGVISNSYVPGTAISSAGVHSFTLTGVAAGTANITIGTGNSSAVTSPINATAVAIRVGAAPASVTVTFDAASYTVGQAATVTVTLKDAAGNAVPNATYTNIFSTTSPAAGLVSNYALGGTGSGLSSTGTITTSGSTGTQTFAVTMPTFASSVKLSATGGSALATANQVALSSATVDVTDANLTAATDAANAATDAANYAADAADAATTAAQEATAAAQAAQDSADAATAAVVALGLRVDTLMASVRAQLTSLSNLLVRIIKKTHA